MSQKVLVIDDSEAIHALLKVRLRDEPIELHSALDGPSGIELAKTVEPDLILLDVEMPGSDGYTVCRALKSDPATDAIPIVFLTGMSSTEEKIKGLDMGATDYICKPFDPAELRARVRASLRTRYLVELLAKKAMIDGLTGLWNRAYFDARLATEMSLARRTGNPLGCIMADVDHFKKINDSFGHPVGDDVLRAISHVLAQTCRAEDVVCRYGGEEFAVLCPNTSNEQAAELAERLRVAIGEHHMTCRGNGVDVTCSFGVADLRGTPPPGLVEMADSALYRAKQGGRNRVEIVACPIAA